MGYQIGGGIEHAVTDNWTLKLEYAYFDFGSETVTGFDGGGDPYNYTADLYAHTLKIGVNYKF
ncbi:MAG: porin family protein [Rhizobiaceae bacterium]|nr:porin family protein [Rhizobiaceae bacterium]